MIDATSFRRDPSIPGPQWGPLGLVLLGVCAAYSNTLHVPFIWDDVPAIPLNPTLAHLTTALHPPPAIGVSGRPILNLSFALNHLMGGDEVSGYHLVNILIHALAAGTLFGLLRRLLSPATALAVAALWALHPLQTEAVTYLSQRAESLMALFYLLTLSAFVRAAESARPWPWLAAAVAACAAGIMTKEPMVTAPVMVLVLDRAFFARSWRAALTQRSHFYAALASTWILLASLMRGLGARGAGLGQGVSAGAYAVNSCQALVHYLRLAFWPHPLVFDYGDQLAPAGTAAALCAIAVALGLAATAIALWRRPAIGCLAAAFFLPLLPATSVIPVLAQPTAEHRMYLALVAPLTALVLVLRMVLKRPDWFAAICTALAVAAGVATWERNRNYHSELGLWQDTVAKRPGNVRAHFMIGRALGREPAGENAALEEYRTALKLRPDYPYAWNAIGLILLRRSGQEAQAVAALDRAAAGSPHLPDFRRNLALGKDNWGRTLAHAGQLNAADRQLHEATVVAPEFMAARFDHALVLGQLGRLPEAEAELRVAANGNDPETAARSRRLLDLFAHRP